MKVLFGGDTHGDLQHLHYYCREAKKAGCSRVVQLGDWGFCFRGSAGVLYEIEQLADNYDVDIWALLGNHDNYPFWEQHGVPLRGDEPTVVRGRPRLTLLPRGARFELDGVRFLACGGAVSIDKASRTPGMSWWPEELITQADFLQCERGGDCDVLLTHDAPNSPELGDFLKGNGFRLDYKMDALSRSSRVFVDEIVRATHPKLLMHGHYHHYYTGEFEGTRVVGLSMNGRGRESYVIMDTEEFRDEVLTPG